VDDRRFTEAVRERFDADVDSVRPPVIAPVRGLDPALRRMQGPFVDAHHQILDALFLRSGAAGCRVILTGLRGDDIFGGLAYMADRARRLQFRGLRGELDAWSAVLGAPTHLLFWSLCVRPWVGWVDAVKGLFDRPMLCRTRSRPRRPRLGSLAL